MPLNIIFMGSPEFAVPALEGLIHSRHHVSAVYSQPPRPAGRGQQLRPCPVHAAAEKHGIEVQTPINFKSPESVERLKAYGADIAVVAAYGLLLPPSVLTAFPKGCINIHPSLLPRWRGAAPIHRTVLAGDDKTAICIMQMDEGLDTGDVILQEFISLHAPHITTGMLHDQLAEQSVPILLRALDLIEAGTVHPQKQAADGVTYAKKISKTESAIDWNEEAEVIDRKVRGLNPYPNAATILNGEPIKIWGAMPVDRPAAMGDAANGTVIDDMLTIACGNNTALRLTMIQRPGKKAMKADEFLNGVKVPVGSVLS